MSHKYQVRQMVRLVRAPMSDSRASGSGVYEVVRLMPADETGEVSYRVRSAITKEQQVLESTAPAQTRTAAWDSSGQRLPGPVPATLAGSPTWMRSKLFDLLFALWTGLFGLAVPLLWLAASPKSLIRAATRLWVRGAL